jgi:hypothetical protein
VIPEKNQPRTNHASCTRTRSCAQFVTGMIAALDHGMATAVQRRFMVSWSFITRNLGLGLRFKEPHVAMLDLGSMIVLGVIMFRPGTWTA